MKVSRQVARGFTVVELIIVIVVIGILASIILVSYSKAQQRAATATLQNDLKNAQDAMEITAAKNQGYPSDLPAIVTPSPKTAMTLKTNPVLPFYSNLTPVQNAVLFATVCGQLVDEGLGVGRLLVIPVTYINYCGSWKHDGMVVWGWTPNYYTTPMTESDITDYVNDLTDSFLFPDRKDVVSAFYNVLRDRFKTMGGTFPITSFWDIDSTPVPKEELPEPDPYDGYSTTFCIEAAYGDSSSAPVWHVIADGQPVIGGC